MSILMMEQNGKNIGEVCAEFEGEQMEISLTEDAQKAIYVKLSPGTELYNRVVMCSQHLEVKPTRAARMLMRSGWLAFVNSTIVNMRRVKNED